MNYEAVIPVPDTTLKSAASSFDTPRKAKDDKTGIHVFPNPANDYTIVSYNMEGIVVMELLSQDGRVIRSENLKPGINQHLFRTEGLPSGVYTLNLKGGSKVLTTKLIIR
ncbi:MAG: T9SS type A sorting domain-containing protein [Lentimicrobium sp.]|nr:T9SS type A sorting domain-containing protein [Lentimicrobium sp.]